MRNRSLVLVALLFLPFACASDETNDRDSSIQPAISGAPSSIESEPFLVVGTVSGDSLQELAGVTTPFLLPNGRLVVPLATVGVIRVFDSNGAFVETLGRPGEGPGEFTRLSAAWPRGDTIEAYDSRFARITRFNPGGSVTVVPIEGRAGASAVPGALSDGWLLSRVTSRTDGGVRDRVVFTRASATGTSLGDVGELDGMERYSTPGFSGPGPLSHAARPVVSGGMIYLAETSSPVIQVLRSSGELERELVWQSDAPVSPQHALQLIVDSAVVRAVEVPGPSIQERLAAFPASDRIPSFWDLRVDEMGFVWVQPFEPGRHSMWYAWLAGGSRAYGEWQVLSPEGVAVGSIVIPDGLTVTQITDSAVVGIYHDELGVEFVHAYRLRRD